MIADVFLSIVLFGVVLYGAARVVQSAQRGSLKAKVAPGALVEDSDSLATAKAKDHNYRMLLEAIRLLHAVKERDELVPSLPEGTRREIEALFEQFYGRTRP